MRINLNSMDYSDSESEAQSATTMDIDRDSEPETLNDEVNAHLWGFMQPCNYSGPQIDFWRMQPTVTLGRDPANQIVFDIPAVSKMHCTLGWDGSNSEASVVIRDYSTNGTYVNRVKVGRGSGRIIYDKDEISFGMSDDPVQNPRFFFRRLAFREESLLVLADYQLGTQLGQGGFGTVYKALHRPSSTWRAVKMIRLGKADDAKRAHETIGREVSIMERLDHPNVCQIHETFFEQGMTSINIVLELVDGGDLYNFIEKSNGLSEPATKDITYQLCSAMKFVHSKGIAHRDLKPENILLTSDVPPMVKITDFGLSKVIDSQVMLRHTIVGTLNYIAPEVIDYVYDQRVDSFSIGVIVHLCLTNTEAFTVPEGDDDLKNIRNRKRNPPKALILRGVSQTGTQFVNRLLQTDPDRRPSMARALVHPWLKGYIPHHRVEIPADDGSETAAQEVEKVTPTVEKVKAKKIPAKERTLRQRLSGRSPRHAGSGSRSSVSGSSLDAAIPEPVTPRNVKKMYLGVPSTPGGSVRRSERKNKGLSRKV